MDKDTNALNWFEIPATDMPRAKKFYETIFEIEMEEMKMGDMHSAFFNTGASGKVGGSVTQSPLHKPGSTGVLIYLNANPDLQLVLNRVESAGGRIHMAKTGIGPNGFMAVISDTEGNAVGLHSNE